MYAQDSIDLLQNSGLQFTRHQDEGIDPVNFAELLMTSGVVIMEEVRFLSFHRYDLHKIIQLLCSLYSSGTNSMLILNLNPTK